jgi:putative transport protein
MLAILIDQPLLALFLVAGIGYPLGRLRIGGATLGIAAVLFVGLAFGALDPRLELPDFVYQFGLVVFVYSVGLTSAPALVSSFRRRGLRDAAVVLAVLVAATVAAGLLGRLLSLTPGATAGLFAGSLTNTPALAAVIERVSRNPAGGAADPVLAYSLTYPIGVVGVIAALTLARRLWSVPAAEEQRRLEAAGAWAPPLDTRSIRVTRADRPLVLDALRRAHGWQVVFGRVRRRGDTHVVDVATTVEAGDIVTAVGTPDEIARVMTVLGIASDDRIELDRRTMDYRRVFVSSREIAGRRLGDLDLAERFGAVITRVRRGDVEMLARDDLILELGDRVRVVTTRANLDAVSSHLGDSYRALSELDILAFSIGPALGLLLGLVPIPFGGFELRLGLAGGPLVVALLLGYLQRTGPIVWVLPFGANLTLRQIGLVLFLAAIGTRAGWEFRTLLAAGDGLAIIAAGATVTCGTALAAAWLAHRILELPFALVGGLVAAVQTQPAVLGFAVEQSGNDLPNLGYARAYPVALIAKILLSQVLLSALGGTPPG